MRYAEKSTRNLVSLTAVVMAIMLVAVLAVGCGGGSSPTEPRPTPGPTPTPVSVIPSIAFVSATPPCGSTINSSAEPFIIFRVHVVTPEESIIGFGLISPQGEVGLGVFDGVVDSTTSEGVFLNVRTTLAGYKLNVTTTGINLYLYPGTAYGGKTPLATSTEPNCGFVILPK